MRFDVSELKTFKDCGRRWTFSSRNFYHLRPRVLSPNLAFGTLFHECLHALYAGLLRPEGPDVDRIIEWARHELEGDTVAQKVISNMIAGYFAGPYQDDIREFEVLDIERQFSFPVGELWDGDDEDLLACGSIDMLALKRGTNEVWGFEHKSCKNFRTDVYHILDEQPKMYYMAMGNILDEINAHQGTEYTVGGIFINEVKKLSTKFEYHRRTCVYTPEQMLRFRRELNYFGQDMARCSAEGVVLAPQASYLKCAMCDFASICEHVGDAPIGREDILQEFQEEFQVRDVDHLDEKLERSFGPGPVSAVEPEVGDEK